MIILVLKELGTPHRCNATDHVRKESASIGRLNNNCSDRRIDSSFWVLIEWYIIFLIRKDYLLRMNENSESWHMQFIHIIKINKFIFEKRKLLQETYFYKNSYLKKSGVFKVLNIKTFIYISKNSMLFR